MTTGNILKKICIFAAPCILSRVLQNLYTLVDSVMVGQAIDSAALAAVGATGSLISLFTETVIGLMTGFSVMAGRSYGGGDERALKKVFANSLIITVITSIVITIFGFLFARGMLVLLQTPAEILDNAEKYLKIIFLGIAATVFYNFLCEMLRALGNGRAPLIFLIISSVIHIVLILVFMYSLKLGIVGAALSTVVSQAIAVVLCFMYIRRSVPEFQIELSDLKPDAGVLKMCFGIGVPMAVTNFVVAFGVIILSFVTNKIGVEYVTAYSCASRVGYIITTPIFGFASATAVFVSQNLGAGRPDRIKVGVRQINLLVTAINCVLFLIFLFASKPLMNVMIKDNEFAAEAGAMYLYCRCTAMFILAFAAMYKNVLTALGKPMFPTISGFLEIAVRYIVPITLSQSLGFLSVPLTDAVAWTILAIFLAPAYFMEIKRLQKEIGAVNYAK